MIQNLSSTLHMIVAAYTLYNLVVHLSLFMIHPRGHCNEDVHHLHAKENNLLNCSC